MDFKFDTEEFSFLCVDAFFFEKLFEFLVELLEFRNVRDSAEFYFHDYFIRHIVSAWSEDCLLGILEASVRKSFPVFAIYESW